MGPIPQHQRRCGTGLRRRLLAVGAGVTALALVAAGCGGGSNSASTGTTPVKGGTAVFAEPPSTTPNYIFPFTSSTYISDVDIFDLQYLMYRPLYWFGQSGKPTVNNSLSLATPRSSMATRSRSRSSPTSGPTARP